MNPEKIAYWFFRLNGCATITNFLVHPDQGGSQRTDVDVLAVRFPYRAELWTSGDPMEDHPVFKSDGKIDIIFAEVKHGPCRLNGPWTNQSDENMQRTLYAVGAFEPHRASEVAEALYRVGCYQDDIYRVRLFAVGDRKITQSFPTRCSWCGMKSWLLSLIVLPDITLKRRTMGNGTAQEGSCMPSLQGRRKNLLKL